MGPRSWRVGDQATCARCTPEDRFEACIDSPTVTWWRAASRGGHQVHGRVRRIIGETSERTSDGVVVSPLLHGGQALQLLVSTSAPMDSVTASRRRLPRSR